MKYRYAICLFLIAFLIQTTFMNIVSVFGATPNLLLCLVIVFSFLYDYNNSGLILGVAYGLLYDICFSEYVGITSMAFLIISISIILVSIVMNKEAVLSVIIITIAATIVFSAVSWGIMAMLGSSYTFTYIVRFLPLYVLYNTIIVVLLYFSMIKKVIRHHYDRYFE